HFSVPGTGTGWAMDTVACARQLGAVAAAGADGGWHDCQRGLDGGGLFWAVCPLARHRLPVPDGRSGTRADSKRLFTRRRKPAGISRPALLGRVRVGAVPAAGSARAAAVLGGAEAVSGLGTRGRNRLAI